jgi:hypothetical protein
MQAAVAVQPITAELVEVVELVAVEMLEFQVACHLLLDKMEP